MAQAEEEHIRIAQVLVDVAHRSAIFGGCRRRHHFYKRMVQKDAQKLSTRISCGPGNCNPKFFLHHNCLFFNVFNLVLAIDAVVYLQRIGNYLRKADHVSSCV